MADVTDVAFRSVVAQCGRPDVFYTEFVSAHGLASAGRERLMLDLALADGDHPIVAQFFGTRPEHLFAAGTLARELGFDGVDINMGCPDTAIMKQGAGAALMKTPELASDLIYALRDGSGGLPVAVKTRLGLYDTNETDAWLKVILNAKPDVLIVHGRTVKEASKVPAHWDIIGRAAAMAHDGGVLCIGNGDVVSAAQGNELCAQWGTDGYMVGRGIFQNPWLFAPLEVRRNERLPAFNGDAGPLTGSGERGELEHTPHERLQLLLMHTDAWVRRWNGVKSFDLMKKFYKVYVSGWPGAAHLRAQLMEQKSAEQVRAIVSEYLQKETPTAAAQ